MKAILMIDNPKTCSECRIVHPDLGGYYCPFEPIHIPDKIATTEKMGWCPLRPLARKPKTAEQMFKELGYEKLDPAFPDWIEYGRVENYPLLSYFRFDTTYCQFNCALEMMNWSDIKAVITQMKELGWIDEILGEKND